MQAAATAVGLVAAALSLGTAGPQAARIWVRRSRVGVSLPGWGLLGASFALWIGYGLRTDNAVVTWTNVVGVGLVSVLLAGGVRADEAHARDVVLGTLAWAGGVVVMFELGLRSPGPVLAAVVLLPAVVRSPQLVRSWGTWRAASASDVSLLTWWLGCTAASLWTLHGLLRPDLFVALGSGGGTLVSAGVLALEHAAASRRSTLAGQPNAW